ncbi:MAG TPA: ABC transporter substrate-binding protein [Anaerolineae bacterium]|nr:ABC transporter substrate-binding protein [Anaerolineae bacterium]
MNRLSSLLILLLILAFSVGCVAPQLPAAMGPKTKVMVMLDWVPNTNHTGIYVAQAKGWYSEEGLDVEIIQPGETGVEQVVATGSADFGISFEEQVTQARAEGVPIVSIAAIIQHNTSGFAAPADRGIKSPKDFEGKKYGAFGSPIERAMLAQLMGCFDADVNKVEFVDVGWADFFTITERGDIDFAWIFYGWTGIEAKLRGKPIDILMLKDYSDCVPDYYTPVIITSEKMIAERPEIVRRFMRATSKGYSFAIGNPAESAQILLKAAPESNPKLVKESQLWLSKQYQADADRWGEQKLEVWERYANWMADAGLLPRRIDASKAFTNEFLP